MTTYDERSEAQLIPINLTVNGDRVRGAVPSQRTLLEWLRYDVGLTGSKQGCDKGDCGACTVLLDGKPVNACLVLAVEADGAVVQTVEGLQRGAELSPLQQAFIKHGATQCGFCIPGVLMSATALLDRGGVPSRDEIRQALSGNLCRCTGYTKILDAVEDAAQSTAARRDGGEP